MHVRRIVDLSVPIGPDTQVYTAVPPPGPNTERIAAPSEYVIRVIRTDASPFTKREAAPFAIDARSIEEIASVYRPYTRISLPSFRTTRSSLMIF